MRHRIDRQDDAWYESEASTRQGMIVELQRIRRRMRARPLPVIALAALITGALTYKLATRKVIVEAEVVLALTEGSLSTKHNGLPVDELRQYVDGVLLPDAKLRDLIERRDLYRSRNRLGIEYAIEELRGQIDIEIWKNTFVYYDEDAANAEHSARIGLTVSDTDPDRAFDLARDLAAIVIESAQENRQKMNATLASEIAATRDGLVARIDELAREGAEKQALVTKAHDAHEEGVAQAYNLELAEIDHEQKAAEKELASIAVSRDALADRIAAAGLDTAIAIVEEHRPDRPEHKGFVIAMIAVVLAVGSLLGSALVLGAFDPRVHDTDDVERLGIAVLGHVPGFAGDRVGSLRSRGAPRGRVTSFSRWRSQS